MELPPPHQVQVATPLTDAPGSNGFNANTAEAGWRNLSEGLQEKWGSRLIFVPTTPGEKIKFTSETRLTLDLDQH